MINNTTVSPAWNCFTNFKILWYCVMDDRTNATKALLITTPD